MIVARQCRATRGFRRTRRRRGLSMGARRRGNGNFGKTSTVSSERRPRRRLSRRELLASTTLTGVALTLPPWLVGCGDDHGRVLFPTPVPTPLPTPSPTPSERPRERHSLNFDFSFAPVRN